MKLGLSRTLAFVGLGLTTFAVTPAHAQTTANGPYYATPSWDQTLPANTRFIVLTNFNSQAVLDRETGLVWQRSPGTDSWNWNDAHRQCNRETVIAGRRGWRLPAIQELTSLMDSTQSAPPLPPGHPFTNVQQTWYWSATTNASFPTFAWVGFFGFEGGADIDTKTRGNAVWCVRGGQGAEPQ